jgi:hypothetical protein
MDRYTIMVVSDDRSPVKRMQVPKVYVKRIAWVGVGVALLFALITWDYWRKTADNRELAGLRVVSAEQGEQIRAFERTLVQVREELAKVRELERKVRIIANLPGAAGVGGEGVSELMPGAEVTGSNVPIPVGVPIDMNKAHVEGATPGLDVPLSSISPEDAEVEALTTPSARHVHALARVAEKLGETAGGRGESLDLLLEQLGDKSEKLASMPSIWPARGWLTSRFGARVSPFTGRTQKHSGIDIASRQGTPIIAPARGRVSFVGKKGPLGNTLVVDHGFGVRTVYGHTHDIHVKSGEKVDRGQLIASIGSTGRSTGPHLHYVVEIDKKPRNPLDYIFD